MIPDIDDFTQSVVKRLTLTADFTVAGNGCFLLVWPHHNPNGVVHVLACNSSDPTKPPFNYLTSLTFDEDLGANFISARTVSGMLAVQSATLTGAAFTVSGVVVGINASELPPITAPRSGESQLTFQKITAYGLNPCNVQALTTVADGVVALAPPSTANPYKSLEKETTFVGSGSLGYSYQVDEPNDVVRVSSPGPTGTNGWVNLTAYSGTQVLWDSNNAALLDGPWVPTNSFGMVEVEAYLYYQAVAAANVTISVFVEGYIADPTTYNPVIQQLPGVSFTQQTVTSAFDNVGGRTIIRAPFFITRVWINLIVTVGTITASNTVEHGAQITARFISSSNPFRKQPISLIGCQGMSSGQQLAVAGLLNVEAVPNANLAQNVPVNLTYIKSFDDLTLANHIVANAPRLGLKFVYARSVYMDLIKTVDFEQLANRANMRALSAGLLDGLRGFWRNFLAPALRAALPAAGGVFGPGGALIGSAIGGLIPDYSSGGQMPSQPVVVDNPYPVVRGNAARGYGAGKRWDRDDYEPALYMSSVEQCGAEHPEGVIGASQLIRGRGREPVQYDVVGDQMVTPEPDGIAASLQSGVIRGFGVGLTNPWDMDEGEFGSYATKILAGRVMYLTSLELLMIINRKTGQTEHIRRNDIHGRIITSPYLEVHEFGGHEVVSARTVAVPFEAMMSWTKVNSPFTVPELMAKLRVDIALASSFVKEALNMGILEPVPDAGGVDRQYRFHPEK